MILTVTLSASIDKLYMLDALEPYTVMRVRKVSNTAGGKGMNVSRVAAQLGEAVTAMGFVGGFVGQYFESLITQPSIRKAFTHVEAETRSCINGWDMARNESTEYLEPGAPVTPEEAERFFADFKRELPNADVVTLSGSLPTGMPSDAYQRLIRLCRKAGKPVLLDTSGETLRAAVQAKPSFIKPNTEELAQLLGHKLTGRDETLRAVKDICGFGIPMVVVSLGAEGALLVCGEGAWQGKPPCIQPKNTVGCGDSMVAGFAVGFARKMPPVEALRLAVAVSAANALTLRTGEYEPADLECLLSQIEIKAL